MNGVKSTRTYHRFTQEKDALLLSLHSQGITHSKMAILIGCPEGSIHGRLAWLLGACRIRNGQPSKTANLKSGFCKCLGGCGKEFKSPDRSRIRICDTCRKARARNGSGLQECHVFL